MLTNPCVMAFAQLLVHPVVHSRELLRPCFQVKSEGLKSVIG